jgi:hypothetical protein
VGRTHGTFVHTIPTLNWVESPIPQYQIIQPASGLASFDTSNRRFYLRLLTFNPAGIITEKLIHGITQQPISKISSFKDFANPFHINRKNINCFYYLSIPAKAPDGSESHPYLEKLGQKGRTASPKRPMLFDFCRGRLLVKS